MLTNPAEDCAAVRGCGGLGRHLGSVNLPIILAAVYAKHTDQQINRVHCLSLSHKKKVTTEDYFD